MADLCWQQAANGDSVIALVHSAPGERRMGPARDRGVIVVRAPVHAHLGFAPIALTYRQTLRRLLRSFRPEVIHFHLPNPSALWAMTIPLASDAIWIAHWHSDIVASRHSMQLRLGYPLYRPVEKSFLRRCRRVIATSPDYLESSMALAPFRERCRVVPLGLNPDRVARTCKDTTWPINGDVFRLICIGRFSYYKALDRLVDCVAQIPGVSLVLVGNGPAREGLTKRIEATGEGHRIQMQTGASDEERNALLEEADALILPSQERTEAFGVVLLEAMRWAKPVVVANIPGSGAPWLVRTSDCGIIVPTGDWDQVGRAIETLRNDSTLRDRLGANGQRALQNRFSIAAVTTAIKAVYVEAESGLA